MLKIKDMNLNNVIRQGDSQPREYQLDTGNLNLNLTNKQATIRLMTGDYKGIAYETTATVSSENKISFRIEDVIPAREYRLEITVNDYVFPSRALDGQFNVDPSSHGQEANIIQVIGKEEIVRDVKARVENELEPLVTSLESAQQAELDRQAQEEAGVGAESARELNEQTRLDKDLLRDDKIAQMEADKDAVIANATVDSEVILARGGKATLGQRLDETTAQLAQNESYPFTSKQIQTTSFSPKPIVVFTFDDAPVEDLNVIKPMFDSFGFKGTIYAIPGLSGTRRIASGYTIDYMTKEQLKIMADADWEIGAHTMTHISMGGASEATIEYEMSESKKVLQDWGFRVTNFSYPFGSVDNLSKRIAAKHFRSSTLFNGLKTSIDAPINKPALQRKSLGSFFDAVDANFPVTNTFEGYYKHWVDDAKNNNKLTIFALHSFAMDATQLGYLHDTLSYCKSLGVDVMTLDEALNHYDNALDIKTYNIDNTVRSEIVFDAKGDLSSGNMVFAKRIPSTDKNRYPQSALPEVYPSGLSYLAISDGMLWSLFGGSVIIHTDKAFGVPNITRQWVYQRWGTGIMYRSATSTGEWSSFVNLTPSAPAAKFSARVFKPLTVTQNLEANSKIEFIVPNSSPIAHTETIAHSLINPLPRGIVYAVYNGGTGIKVELVNLTDNAISLPVNIAFNVQVI